MFDLDDALWDAAAATVEGWNRALTEMSVPYRITLEGIRSVSGRPFVRCTEMLLPALCPRERQCSGLPKAETLRLLASRRRLQRAIYVGDMRGDQEAAGAAGMDFAFVRYGLGSAENASLPFDSFERLVDRFLSWATSPQGPGAPGERRLSRASEPSIWYAGFTWW